MSNVSVLGLGAMGTALADAFVDRGHAVTVWNRTAVKAEPLVARGARRAGSVAQATTASELVIVCVVDNRAAAEVLATAGPLEGRTVVNLTNGTPEEARAFAEQVTARGGLSLDGGIMAVPPMIGSPEALVLYSGSADAFRMHERTLATLGTSRFLGADPALASLHDLALLGGMYGLFAGFLHASALIRTAEVRVSDFLGLLRPWLEAMLGALPDLAGRIDRGDHASDVASNLGMQLVALDNILAASREAGVAPDLLEPLRVLVQRRVAHGHGGDDLSGVAELLRGAPPAARSA